MRDYVTLLVILFRWQWSATLYKTNFLPKGRKPTFTYSNTFIQDLTIKVLENFNVHGNLPLYHNY